MTPTHNPLTDLLIWLYHLPANEIAPLLFLALVIWILVAITPDPVIRVRGEQSNHKGRGFYYNQDPNNNRRTSRNGQN